MPNIRFIEIDTKEKPDLELPDGSKLFYLYAYYKRWYPVLVRQTDPENIDTFDFHISKSGKKYLIRGNKFKILKIFWSGNRSYSPPTFSKMNWEQVIGRSNGGGAGSSLILVPVEYADRWDKFTDVALSVMEDL